MTAWQFELLGYPVRLAEPEYLLIALLAVLGTLLSLLVAVRRARVLENLAPAPLLERIAPGASPQRMFAKLGLGWSALLLGAVAMSQPQCGTHSELAKRFGIDLVIALDASKSMLARDVKPSRIERAKLELGGLLDKLKGDRVGIVIFAGDAFVQCPLTSDYAAAKMFLKAVDVNQMPIPGTDLSRALETSRDLLMEADRGAKSRAIVVLSDGEDFGDGTDPMLKTLKDDGIRVLTVGIGSVAGEPIPELDKKGNVVGYLKDKSGNTVMSRLDEAGLQTIADKTDGVYIPSLPGSIGVGQVAEELDRMQKAELESRITVSYEERYAWFLGPALALLLLAMALRPGRTTRSAVWGASGICHGVAVLAFASLGVATLIEPSSTLDNHAADVLRQAVVAGQIIVGLLFFAAGSGLDMLVKRTEAGP